MKTGNNRNLLQIMMLIVIILLFFVNTAWTQQKTKKQTHVKAIYTSEPVVIDGLLDDSCWKKAQLIKFYIPVSGKNPISTTNARILWDDQYLYVGYKAYDKDVWSYLTERDSTAWREDVLEVFLRPNMKRDHYVDIEINALGTIYDAQIIKLAAGGGDNHRWDRWNIEGMKIGITIGGTLNNINDVDKYWQMEIAIPYAGIQILKGKVPKAGEKWQINLARYDFSVFLPEGVELSASSPLTKENFHQLNDYSIMEFVK